MSYSFDISPHDRYAKDQKTIQEFYERYHLTTAESQKVAVQAKISGHKPKPPAIDVLWGLSEKRRWSLIEPPEIFETIRDVPRYIFPSGGPPENILATIKQIQGIVQQRGGRMPSQPAPPGTPKTEEDQVFEEGQKLIKFLDEGVNRPNELAREVFAKMSQFLQA